MKILLASVISAISVAALPTSPSPGIPGVFINFHAYSASLYGSLPASILNKQSQVEIGLSAAARADRRQAVFDYYSALTSFMHEEVKQTLANTFGFHINANDMESFWIDQSLFVRQPLTMSSSRWHEFMFALEQHPHVVSIKVNEVIAQLVLPVEVSNDGFTLKNQGPTWSVRQVHAPDVWSVTQGQGIRVAIIDTGVNVHHESLTESYAGNQHSGNTSVHDYNWFDPLEFRHDEWWCEDDPPNCALPFCCMDEPFDNVGHGTHVMGIIAGSQKSGIGIAPGVSWMAAKGCRDGNCFRYGLAKAAQWVVCPTRIDGTQPDCSRGADIVSNSWGGKDGKDEFYASYVKVWREAGLIPVFSNGNSGPNCGALSSPGDFRQVIGIGALNVDKELAKFSSRGPGPTPRAGNETSAWDGLFARLKPDFVCPGVKIISARALSNDSYMTMSGTSMAAPCASGILALLLSVILRQSPALFTLQDNSVNVDQATLPVDMYDKLYAILKATAQHDVGAPLDGGGARLPIPGWPRRDQCDGRGYQVWPNMFYGYGRLDAKAAVDHLQRTKE
jgi:hypothetical protein